MAQRLRSPIKWFGGKGNMISKLLNLMPPHDYYVEPFGGGASLLFAKEPAKVETYNDIDEGLVNLFRALRDPEQFAEFKRLVDLTLYSRAEWDLCRETWQEQTDPVQRAYRWFVVNRMSFGGQFGSGWGTVITDKALHGRAPAYTCFMWKQTRAVLDAIHRRLQDVQIECADWRVILERYNVLEYLAYCDPPYIHATRLKKRYGHELSDGDHRELIDCLLTYPAMVMLSAYDHEIYQPLADAGWNKTVFETACHAAGRTRHTKIQGNATARRKQPRREVVWRNPAAMAAFNTDLLTASSAEKLDYSLTTPDPEGGCE